MISTLDYPQVDLIVPEVRSLHRIVELLAPDVDICVFWADDDKPVTADFLRQMAIPLLADGSDRAVMHLWAGNALAVPRAALIKACEENLQTMTDSFMKLALGFLDTNVTDPARAHVAFSSTERLAPLCGEPVGRVC